MTATYAVETIISELKFQAKSIIIEKYNASDTQIGADGFSYTVNNAVVYRHAYSAITTNVILSALYREMIYLCVQTVPLSLLTRKGGTQDIVRSANKDWDIRTPDTPDIGENLDIDEMLAQIVVYRALAYFGVSSYAQNAKELLSAYKDSLVIPTIEEAETSIAFRFSSDGASWHDNYQNGDTTFAISKNGTWSSNIPLGGAGSGVTKFTQLKDVPTTYTAGKILKVNASGTGIEFSDEKTSITKFTQLADVPKTLLAGKILVVNSGGTGLELVDMPTSTGGTATSEELIGYLPKMPYDFKTATTKQFLNLDAPTVFKIALDAETPKMQRDKIYHMQVYPNGNAFSFDAQIKQPSPSKAFTGLSLIHI